MDAIKGLMDFIDRAPTAFHAVAAIRAELEAAGYACLSERERWQLEPGGRYYLTRNGSSVIAFRVPEGGLTHFQIDIVRNNDQILLWIHLEIVHDLLHCLPAQVHVSHGFDQDHLSVPDPALSDHRLAEFFGSSYVKPVHKLVYHIKSDIVPGPVIFAAGVSQSYDNKE